MPPFDLGEQRRRIRRIPCFACLLIAFALASAGCSDNADPTSGASSTTAGSTSSSASSGTGGAGGTGGMASTGGAGGMGGMTGSTGGAGGGASSTASAGGSDGGPMCEPAPPACNAPDQCGALVTFQEVAADAPAPLGGGTPDGTYVLTAMNLYTGPNGMNGPAGIQSKLTMAFSGGAYTQSSETILGGFPPQIDGISGMFATAGTSLTLTRTCPPPTKVVSGTYTLSGDVLMIYDPMPAYVAEAVLMKQ